MSTTVLQRMVAAAFLVVVVAGCGTNVQTASTKAAVSSPVGSSGPGSNVWVLEGDDLQRTTATFAPSVDRSATQRAVVYKGGSGATVRMIWAPNMLAKEDATAEPDAKAMGIETVGTSALTAQQRLGGTEGMTITISGAASIEDAKSILSEVGDAAAAGTNFGFTGGQPTEALGSLKLVGYIGPEHPAATGGEFVQKYSTNSGTTVTIRQAQASETMSLDLAAVPLTAPITSVGGHESVVEDGGRGAGPTLVTLRGQTILWISGTILPDELSGVVNSLTQVDRDTWQSKVDSELSQAIDVRTGKDFGEGIVTYRSQGERTIACRSGSEPLKSRCGWAMSEWPMVVAMPTPNGHLIAGCLDGAVTEIAVNGSVVSSVEGSCGRKFVINVSSSAVSITATGVSGLDAPVVYRFQLSK